MRPGGERTILVVRETAWGDPLAISTRRLAGGFLAAGHRVHWVNPPVPPTVGAGRRQVDGSLTTTQPITLAPWTPRLAALGGIPLELSWRLSRPSLRSLPRPDLLWLSHPKSLGVDRCLRGVPVVWHVTDFYPQKSSYPARIDELLRIGLPRADRIVASSAPLAQHLIDRYELQAEVVSVLGHAASQTQLAARRDGPDPLDDGTTRPRVIYVGTLSEAEPSHLRTIAESPDHRLILIGPPGTLEAELRSHPGAELLGPRAPHELAALLPWGDVGLISYRDAGGDRHRFTTPMKSYDYAAASLAIVSPSMPALDAIDPPRRIHRGHDLVEVIAEAIADRPALGASAHAWAKANSWDDRTDEALALIDTI